VRHRLKSYQHGNPRIQAPLTIGHEFTGLIDSVGDGVTGFSVGQRIVMATSISCGQCRYCRSGWRNLCVDLAPMGFAYPGGMAEYVVIPERAIVNGHVVTVPDGVPAEQAALSEPLSCAVNAVASARCRRATSWPSWAPVRWA
jgi:L-iditol 2-dehydrogenase